MKRNLISLRFAAMLMAAALAAGPLAAQAQEKKAAEEKKAPADDAKQLHSNVEDTIARLKKTDPGIDKFFKDAAGYVVFPRVGKAGFIFGGGHGDGEVYEKGKMVGTASVTLGTVGLQVGAQEYSQILFFENSAAVDRFKQNKFEFAGNVSAVILKSGAAVTTKYNQGTAVFVLPTKGAMAEAAVGTQKFNFKSDQPAPAKK